MPSEALAGSDDTVLLNLVSKVKVGKEEGAYIDGLEVAVQHHSATAHPTAGACWSS